MKKLRMIVTSVIVLAIVGSAFAFNAKKVAVFCYSTNDNSTCNAILDGKAIVTTGGTLFHYYNGWDGLTSSCTGTQCTPTIRLITDVE